MTHTFISSPVSVLTGDAARVALQSTNDAAHYTEGKGVLSVPLERWQEAQAYERATWLEHGLMLTEDRNAEHAAMFDDYKALPYYLGDTIELGCGPFTNLRYIIQPNWPKSVTLVDPLFKEYLRHPHCAYPDTVFLGNSITWSASAIEDYHTSREFDTLVMINVLSHCTDAQKVFSWINAHIAPGGYLVFHEPARDINPLTTYDAGHPLSYTQDVIEDFLSGYTQVYRNGDYFIGVKK